MFRPATVDVEVLEPIDTRHWQASDLNTHIRDVRNRMLAVLGQPLEPVAETTSPRRGRPPGKTKTSTKAKTKAKTRARAQPQRPAAKKAATRKKTAAKKPASTPAARGRTVKARPKAKPKNRASRVPNQ
ncbi:MAG TPA: hypothetical protein DCP75_15680 [Haliea salexigens]|uniref:Uncharacterized protein n=1 Tax=Haliea salexigens TaxID=287487 RepID=A0A3C1KS04_9GAMM|nr:hypothetical protein [Haliea salexigens]